MHSKELRHRSSTGSGRLAHLCLKNSSLFVGLDFGADPKLKALLASNAYFPCVLYPGPSSHMLTDAHQSQNFTTQLSSRKPLVFVLDASWSLAKQLLKLNPFLEALPRFSFETNRRSTYTFKRQPQEYCLSTIEALDEVLLHFESLGIEKKDVLLEKENLMQVFDQLVRFQSSFSPHQKNDQA